MRWRFALIGLLVSAVVALNVNRYFTQESPDLGVLSHIDVSGYNSQEGDPQIAKHYVDFDESMQTAQYAELFKNKGMAQLLDYFKDIYNKNSFLHVRSAPETKIPHIFHYIWLGRKLPNEYRPLLKTWIDNHPDWTFIFYVDNPENYDLGILLPGFTFEMLQDAFAEGIIPSNLVVVDVKNLAFDNRVFFDEATNYGERSDILKWEAVYRLGGCYFDVDHENFKSLDMLNSLYDLYVGIQPLDTGLVQLGAALFAAKSGHPVLEHCIKTIKEDRSKPQIVVKTGPIHFTRSFLALACSQGNIDIALPASYFYPCSYNQKGFDRASWIKPESFAVHHWAGSWLKPEGDVRNQHQ